MSIGTRLKEARKRLKLKQEDFAERCGVVLKTQSRFERDEFTPSGEYLLALDALGIDASYILTGRPSLADETEQALIEAFRRADESTQTQLAALLGIKAPAAISADKAPGAINHAARIKVGVQTSGKVKIKKLRV